MTCDADGMMTITRPDATVLTSPPPRRRRPPNLVRGVACDPPVSGWAVASPGGPATDEQTWRPDRLDDQDRPVAGTRGHAAFHIAWDDTPPAERAEADDLTLRRAHLLAA